MKKNMHTWTKKQLWSEMQRCKESIKKIGIPEDEKESKKLDIIKTAYIRAKRHFYECRFCADAKIETITNKRGDEEDRLISSCKGACRYHGYFIEQMEKREDEITKGLNEFLSN